MNIVQKVLQAIDDWQRKHGVLGFPYAVIKKYGEDQAGYQAALLTYYGFLSLFPLLLVVTTLISIFAGRNEALQHTVSDSLASYFPTLGSQLGQQMHGMHKSGLPLVIGTIFTLYGARGVADAFRSGVNHVWHIPRLKRDSFPVSVLKSLSIIMVGGAGFLLASVSSSYAAAAGHGLMFHALSIIINVFILFWIFIFLINVSLPRHVTLREIWIGALVAATGIVLLQVAGGAVLAHQLKNLNALYSYFAIALGLLFWIYLQAQMVYYALEVATVQSQRLWPRGLTPDRLTEADKRSYEQQAAKEQQVPSQDISTDFKARR